jgi:hypothetical protein
MTESSESEDESSNASSYKSEVLKMERKKANQALEKKISASFNRISNETTNLIKVKDIKVEIDMVVSILKSQQEVIKKFGAAIPTELTGTEYTESLKALLDTGEKKLSILNEMSEKSLAVERAVSTSNSVNMHLSVYANLETNN